MIRDRLVCVINDDGIQRRLLAEKHLTYKKAVELEQSLETAVQNMKDLKTKKDEVIIYYCYLLLLFMILQNSISDRYR